MNFLAHSLLSGDGSAEMAGQFVADFVRGRRAPPDMPTDMWHGVLLHRRIDAFTDAHAEVAAARTRFRPPLRRLAGILLDVTFDHLLADDWSRYARRPLDAHIEHVHRCLAREAPAMPPAAVSFVNRLQRDALLARMRRFDGVERTLARLARRGAAFAPLERAGTAVAAELDDLRVHFARFFPALIAHVTERQAMPLAGARTS